MPLPTRLLKGLSIARLEKLILQKRRTARLEPLERERARLRKRLKRVERKIARLQGNGVLGPHRKKRKVSAATRRKMAAAQRARWQKKAGAKGAASGKPKRTRKLSAAGRAAIIAGVKKRMARIAAEKKQAAAAGS